MYHYKHIHNTVKLFKLSLLDSKKTYGDTYDTQQKSYVRRNIQKPSCKLNTGKMIAKWKDELDNTVFSLINCISNVVT